MHARTSLHDSIQIEIVSLGDYTGTRQVKMASIDVTATLQEVSQELLRLGVERLRLFGSRARGDAREDSDVDLLVEFAAGRKNFDAFMDVADLLETRFPVHVDLLTPEAFEDNRRERLIRESIVYEIGA